MAIRVLLADDQPLMRMALRTSLQPESDMEVVGEARDGGEAVRLAARLRPDVVVMDIRMPILDGITAARRIVEQRGRPPTRVLMMTTFDLDEYIVDALQVEVRDDGRGAPAVPVLVPSAGKPPPAAGFGLVSMQQRAALLDGEVVTGPGERGGFRVTVLLPLGAG